MRSTHHSSIERGGDEKGIRFREKSASKKVNWVELRIFADTGRGVFAKYRRREFTGFTAKAVCDSN